MRSTHRKALILFAVLTVCISSVVLLHSRRDNGSASNARNVASDEIEPLRQVESRQSSVAGEVEGRTLIHGEMTYKQLSAISLDEEAVAQIIAELGDKSFLENWRSYIHALVWFGEEEIATQILHDFIIRNDFAIEDSWKIKRVVLSAKLIAITAIGCTGTEQAHDLLREIASTDNLRGLLTEWYSKDMVAQLDGDFSGNPISELVRFAAWYGLVNFQKLDTIAMVENAYSNVVSSLRERLAQSENPGLELSRLRNEGDVEARSYSMLISVLAYRDAIENLGGLTPYLECCSGDDGRLNQDVKYLRAYRVL
ncbi:MAG: hypothetical protein GC168_16185 [Candidatus Hydrogenedens sp.]|nr:hypothetical protein [Candidatus Hydrogenedens sp.]